MYMPTTENSNITVTCGHCLYVENKSVSSCNEANRVQAYEVGKLRGAA